MCDACDLVFIRHEEAEGNVIAVRSKFFSDHSGFSEEFRSKPSIDWKLTEEGKSRAMNLGKWVRESFDLANFQLLTSPVLRAKETAGFILPAHFWQECPEVRGRLWGGIECLPWNEWPEHCKQHGLAGLPSGFREVYPNGESMGAVYDRIGDFLKTVTRNAIVVTHGENLLAVRMHFGNIPEDQFSELEKNGRHARNGHLIWYSKRNPLTGWCSSEFSFKREYFEGIDSGWEKLPVE